MLTNELAERLIRAHERAAASATDPRKAAQHLESARHYRETYGIAAPDRHPPYAEIYAQLERIGLADAVADFWRFCAGQDHPGIGQREYQKSFMRLRKRAVMAAERHRLESVWIPVCVPCGTPMKFVEVKPGPPKGEREWFPIQQRYSKS